MDCHKYKGSLFLSLCKFFVYLAGKLLFAVEIVKLQNVFQKFSTFIMVGLPYGLFLSPPHKKYSE